MSSGSGLPPSQHAAFAVASRLISCLVTEKILRALYVAIPKSSQVVGLLIVLSTDLLREREIISRTFSPHEIFALVPLRHRPILEKKEVPHTQAFPVSLIDPLDMYPEIFELAEVSSSSCEVRQRGLCGSILDCLAPHFCDRGSLTAMTQVEDPVCLWNKFVHKIVIRKSLRTAIENEIRSSFDYQLSAYLNPPKRPLITSPPIAWEQSLVAGHPTHPMHRARLLPFDIPDYDWYNPLLFFTPIDHARLDVFGPFAELTLVLAERAARKSRSRLPNDSAFVFMPVHQLQVPMISKNFPDVELLDPEISLRSLAQSSIRTVILPEFPGMALKLAIGVKISSSLRTISHFTANFGPRFSKEVIPKLSIDPEILFISREIASAVYKSTDPEVAKHLTAVIREEYQPGEGETLIVCAALLEMDHEGAPVGVSALESTFNLDTFEKREYFLNRYLQLACKAFLPPLIENGVAFEAHSQNVLARFDITTGRLLGFVIRDLGGLRVHPPTLRQSTGVNFRFLPGHCVVTETLQETYPKFYHAFVQSHIQRLIRLLKMHHNGQGWEMLRKHMDALIPASHPLWKEWLSPESKLVPSKCLLRMRIQNLYRDVINVPFPNMIQYRGAENTLSESKSSP